MRFGVLVAPIPDWMGRPDGSAAICQLLHTRMSSPAVGDGIHNPFAAEAHMTIQSLWTGPIGAGKDGTRLSFWRRVVAAIAEGRQKKADAVVEEYLQRHAEYQDREQKTGSHSNRGMAFDQSLRSRVPRHARVTLGEDFDQREIGRNTSATYDSTGSIVVASPWLAFYVAAVIHLL